VPEMNETGERRRERRRRATRRRSSRKRSNQSWYWLAGLLVLVVLSAVYYRQSSCYEMCLGEQTIAVVADKGEALEVWEAFLEKQEEKLGRAVVTDAQPAFTRVSKRKAGPVSTAELEQKLAAEVALKTEACVLKVDGEPFITFLDQEKLENMLTEYKERFIPEKDEDVSLISVEFAERVEMVKELVDVRSLDTEEAVKEKLYSLKVPDTIHVVQKGDSFWDIAIKYETTVSELLQLNPQAVPEKLMPGDEILIKPGKPQLSVLVTMETTVTESIPAPTKYIDDASLLRNDRRVVEEGAPGEKEVTYKIVFENGHESTMEVLAEKVLKEPVERVVKRGTRTFLARGVGRNFGVVSATRVTSDYGWRIHPIYKTRRFHEGIDLAAPVGRSVHAYTSGTVTFAGRTAGLGLAVYIDHGNGLETRYGHLSKIYVKKGQKVSTGDKIGAVGSTGLSTGPHLHFEVRKNGKPQNPWDYI